MDVSEEYPEYPVFKGLQKPLEFWGFRGRYVWWAMGAVFGAILAFIAGYTIDGFVLGLVLSVIILGFGYMMIEIRQRKGLHTKKIMKGVFIIYKRREF